MAGKGVPVLPESPNACPAVTEVVGFAAVMAVEILVTIHRSDNLFGWDGLHTSVMFGVRLKLSDDLERQQGVGVRAQTESLECAVGE
jgi:hypothetical protein